MTSGTVYVMDIDDTIVLHTKGKHDLYNMNSDTELLELISGLNYQKLYLYTNGTYGHGYNVSSNLQLNDNGVNNRDICEDNDDSDDSESNSKSNYDDLNNELNNHQ